jgi:hypothetical protein
MESLVQEKERLEAELAGLQEQADELRMRRAEEVLLLLLLLLLATFFCWS